MLVVHPTSTCDVCLDRYTWDSAPSTPHSISCGHVFCRRCLENVNPRACPLCRRPYHIERARKLHVDLASDVPAYLQSSTDIEARQLEERVADVSGEESSDDDCRAVIEEVIGWLESRPSDAHRVLRECVSLLHRYKMLKENLHTTRDERDKYRRKLRISEREHAQDKLLFQGREESLDTHIADVIRKFNKKLDAAESERQRLEVELAKYQTSFKTNPLPPPPEPVPISSLPVYAYPKHRRHGAPHGYIPESSSLSKPSLPRPPKSPDWRGMSLNAHFPKSSYTWDLRVSEDAENAPGSAKTLVIPPRPDYIMRHENSMATRRSDGSVAFIEHARSNSHRRRSHTRRESTSGISVETSVSSGRALGLIVDDNTPRANRASLRPSRRSTEPAQVVSYPTAISSQHSVSSSLYVSEDAAASRGGPRRSTNSLTSLVGFEFLVPPTSTDEGDASVPRGETQVQDHSGVDGAAIQTQRLRLLDQLVDDPSPRVDVARPVPYIPHAPAMHRSQSESRSQGHDQGWSRALNDPRISSSASTHNLTTAPFGGPMVPFPSDVASDMHQSSHHAQASSQAQPTPQTQISQSEIRGSQTRPTPNDYRNPYSSSYPRVDSQGQIASAHDHNLYPQSRARTQSATVAPGAPYIQDATYPGGYASQSALSSWSRTSLHDPDVSGHSVPSHG